jgi:hypothetical protein
MPALLIVKNCLRRRPAYLKLAPRHYCQRDMKRFD